MHLQNLGPDDNFIYIDYAHTPEALEYALKEIKRSHKGDICCGGTGTGAAPIVAQVAKELGILTVAVVTKPFELEGTKRMKIAQEGIKELVEEVDSLITIPNQKLLEEE